MATTEATGARRASIGKLILEHKPGHALSQDFYCRADVYEHEVERLFLKVWILVGHQSQLAHVGDYFLTEVAGESVIVVRQDAHQINALINVCRHRGSRVCLEEQGHAPRFVCPYHAWTYGLDGVLLAAPQVADTLDKGKYPLRRIQLENFQGMLFINFDPDARFDPIAADLAAPLAPYDLANARIAHRQSYTIDANWKLALENFCECYHCIPAHREYAAGHGRARPAAGLVQQTEQVMGRASECGLSSAKLDRSFKKAEGIGLDRYFDRYPLLKGHVTGSRDGRPVAPLMGSIRDYDGGATDFQMGPLSYGLAYCDYVVLYRFVPLGKDATECEVIWLVRGDASEGEDYSRDELIWMWDVTTIADKRIIQDNSRGVKSRFYEPGPLTPMEYFTQIFTEWYLNVLRPE